MRYNSRTSVYHQSPLAELLVDLGHEGDDELNELVFVHPFCMKVGYEEADVVASDGFPSEDYETFRTLHEEAHEPPALDRWQFVWFLDADAYPHRIDGSFDEGLFVLVPADDHRGE